MAFAINTALVAVFLFVAVATGAVPAGEFLCTDEGYWPDPDDCTLYHVCVHFPNADPEYVDAYVGQCEDGAAYDPQSTACRFTLDDPVCTRGPVKCNYPGQWGVVEEAPAIYWQCDNFLRPVYRACADGDVFNGRECVAGPTTAAPPAGPRPPTGGVCLDPGVWADPADCRGYYSCSSKLKLSHHKCWLLYHFDSVKGKCVKGTCKD